MADIGKDLERLARALCEADGRDPDAPEMFMLNEPKPTGTLQWMLYVSKVRAVLDELKNVSPEMLDALWPSRDLYMAERLRTKSDFVAMLDSILSQTAEG